jgi:hypothetical protein
MPRKAVVAASVFAAIICSTPLFGAAAQSSNISITQEQLKQSEIDGPNHQPIKICALSAVSFVNGQIEFLDIKCQNKLMRLDPSNFAVELAKDGQIVISIPYTEPETMMFLGLEQGSPADPSLRPGASTASTGKRQHHKLGSGD